MRIRWTAIALCGSASIAAAQSLPDRLRACLAEPDGVRRLACYDAAAAPFAKTIPAAAPALTGAPKLSPTQEFGLEGEQIRKLKEKAGAEVAPVVQGVRAHVSAVARTPYGRLRVRLDNEQVWEQAEDNTRIAFKPGAEVSVTRGALGSFWMGNDSREATRVKRVR